MSPLPRAGDAGIGAGSRGAFVLAQSHSHDKTSQMLVPTTSPSSPARGLTAARCHNRTHWARWVVFVIVRIGIAFIFKPGWQFLSDLSEQLIWNIHFGIKWYATSLHLRTWGGCFGFLISLFTWVSTPRKDSTGLQPRLSLGETQDLYTEERYGANSSKEVLITCPGRFGVGLNRGLPLCGTDTWLLQKRPLSPLAISQMKEGNFLAWDLGKTFLWERQKTFCISSGCLWGEEDRLCVRDGVYILQQSPVCLCFLGTCEGETEVLLICFVPGREQCSTVLAEGRTTVRYVRVGFMSTDKVAQFNLSSPRWCMLRLFRF